MVFKTTPFRHQLDEWTISKDLPRRAIFWEQGTGKTKLVIDTVAHLLEKREIDGLFVVAPNGVHRNWVTEELPTHASFPFTALSYRSGGGKSQAQDLELLLRRPSLGSSGEPELVVLAMTYDAIITKRGKEVAKRFLVSRRCLYVLDESTRIKSPNALRTKTILASSPYAPYKRILTGTPVANGAFDVYAPIKFLDGNFWKDRGFKSFSVFKNVFGVWRDGYNGNRVFKQLVGFVKLDELHEMLREISTRVTKDDVLDLPPKLYSRYSFELGPHQRRAYHALKTEFRVDLDSGAEISAPLAIVRLIRLQQILSGFMHTETWIPHDPDDPDAGAELKTETVEFAENPRLKLLVDICNDQSAKTIIWARFRHDINLICGALGDRAVRYDGATRPEDRARALESFQRGSTQFFVANPATAGEGLTLHAARTVVYYSNSFKLIERLQSEDRAHRIGQEHPVHYIDIVAPETIDEHIVGALRSKLDIASQITGDKLKEWL